MTGSPDYVAIKERLLKRPGRKAWIVGTDEVYLLDPLTGALVAERGHPTFNEVIRSEAEIMAAKRTEKPNA